MIARDKYGNVLAVSEDDGTTWTQRSPGEITTVQITAEERESMAMFFDRNEGSDRELLLEIAGFLRLVADGLPASREEASELLNKLGAYMEPRGAASRSR